MRTADIRVKRREDGHRSRSMAIGSMVFALAARAPRPCDPLAQEATSVVARLELAAPYRSPFVLHATLPIPKGVFPRADGSTPFQIESHGSGRERIPAQVEIVSRYPTGEADVVEIIAPVELAETEPPNSRVVYDVLLDPHAIGRELERAPRASELFDGEHEGRIGLRTCDVYGNVYWADLCGATSAPSFGSLRVLKNGPHERERRLYATLVPSGTPNATEPPLAHMMGVHAYVTERSGDEAVSLDLRVNNGAVAGSREAHPLEATLGIVYWKSVELVLPKSYRAVSQVRDPFLGEPYEENESRVYPIVAPLPGDKLHMMGPEAQFERRLVIVPESSAINTTAKDGATSARSQSADRRSPIARAALANTGLAFCARGERLWSWFNPQTARYFPQRDLLASVDFYKRGGHGGKAAVRARQAAELEDLRAGIESGTPRGYYVHASVMGWAHPWFVKEAGGVGGEGIATFEGYYAAAAASREGYTYLELLHRMNVSRQSEAAYDRFGDPVGYHQWLDAEGKIPFDFRTNGGIFMPPFLLPMKRGPAASQQVRDVVARDLRPPYDMGTPYEADGNVPDREDNLLAWWPHDDQHMIRYTKNTKALVWLGNDAMAKDDLILSAELYHLMRHESPHVEASWSPGVTLEVWEKIVAAHPHQGLWFGREDGWGIDSMCAAYSIASEEWRARNRAWFDRMSKLLIDAEQPSGLLQRMVNERLVPTKYTVAQTFECFFLIHALRCMNESVFRGVDDERRGALEKLAVKGVDYLMWGPPWARIQASWQPNPVSPTIFEQGPRQGIAVSMNDNFATPPFSDAERWGPNYLPSDGLAGGVEIFHPWAALSYAQEITNDSAGAGLENRYLRRALDCAVPHKDWKSFVEDLHKQALDPSMDNSANWIGLLGKLQSLGKR